MYFDRELINKGAFHKAQLSMSQESREGANCGVRILILESREMT